MRRNILKDSRGMTLVEMLISFAIFSVMMIGVFSLMTSMTKMYQKSNNEVVVQNEVQTLMQQLENYIIDADRGVKLDGDKVYILKSDSFSILTYDSANDKLYYSDYTSVISTEYTEATDVPSAYSLAKHIESTSIVTNDLLAEYVSEFNVTNPDTTLTSSLNYINIELQMNKDEKKYTANKNIYLRNEVTNETTTVDSTDTSSTEASAESTEESTEESTASVGHNYTVSITGPVGGSGQIKLYVTCNEGTDYCYIYFTIDSDGKFNTSGTFINNGVYADVYTYELYAGEESEYSFSVSSS